MIERLAAVVALLAASGCRVDYRCVAPAWTPAGNLHVVVEIPAGTNAKWQVSERDGALEPELQRDGRLRVIEYLGYPGNYGMIPSTHDSKASGGDGDPIDVLVLGPAVERGTIMRVKPVAVLRLFDDGERDDKIIAVPLRGPLSDIGSRAALEARHPGVTHILATWFTRYDRAAVLVSDGWGDEVEARRVVSAAVRSCSG